jgi:hypothetical protein
MEGPRPFKKHLRGFASIRRGKRREAVKLGGKAMPKESRSFSQDAEFPERQVGRTARALI